MSGGDGRVGLSGAGTAAERRGEPGPCGPRCPGPVPPTQGAERVWNRLPQEGPAGTDDTPQRYVRSEDSPERWPERRPPVGRARPSAPPIAVLQRGGTRSTVGRREAQTGGLPGQRAALRQRGPERTQCAPGVLGKGAGSGAGAAGAPPPSGAAPRHVRVAPCWLCSERLPSPARCLGKTRCFSCSPLPWRREQAAAARPVRREAAGGVQAPCTTKICLRSKAASEGEGGEVTVTLPAG
ncbi:PREDICTED: collagen alpha-2(I) chain-like [Pseudopodoces humilis]|uniref:collagen alpha-2(I) chain-like n=1 Tax=Pseudopodoces humilis TaxID=181119 RepID=UPI00039559EA|nr:PREDICTED: collagen alpha-2(I) chain-like [Pseudopodoces humilis]